MRWRWAIILGFFLISTGAFASTCVEIFGGNELFQTEDTLFTVLGENSINNLRAQRSERVPGIPIRSIEQHTISWMKQVMGDYTRTEHFNLLSLEKKKSIRNLQKKLNDTSTTGKKNILLSYEFVSGLPNSSSGFRGINFENFFLDYNLNGYKQVPMAYSLDVSEINELFFLYKILPIDVDIIPKTVDGFARSARGSFEHDTLHNKKIADKMTMTTRQLHTFHSNFEKIKALAKNKEESTMAEVLLFNLWHEKYCMDLSKGSHCWAALESLRTKTDIDFRILINDVPELKQIVKDEAKVRALVGATLDLITKELK